MSNRVLLLLFVVLTLSSGVAVAAVAAGAGETHQGIIAGYLFTECSACVPELISATTNGKALGRDAVHAVLNGTVHGGLICHKSEAGDGVARPVRNSREGGVPGVAEGAEAESSPHDRQGHTVSLARSRSVARRSSGLNDDGMVGMRPTSSIHESAEGETLPRGRGGLISHTCEAGDGFAWPARNNGKGGVPAVAEGAEAESRPRDRHGHTVPLDGARRPSGLNDDGMVGMRPTSLIRESAEGETFPRSGRGGEHPLNIIGDSWPAHPPADGSIVSAPFLLDVDALHLAMHIPNKESFHYIPMLLPASGMFAAAAAGKPRHRHVADTVLIALMIMMAAQFPRRDQEKKTRRGRTRAAAAVTATATALLVLLAAAALPNGAAAARPLHGGGGRGHVQAAAPPTPPRVMPKSLASSGLSSCTNDPNTMGAIRPCVHP